MEKLTSKKVAGHQTRLKDKTYEELAQLAEVTQFPMSQLLAWAWEEFKNSKRYATLMLFANNDGE